VSLSAVTTKISFIYLVNSLLVSVLVSVGFGFWCVPVLADAFRHALENRWNGLWNKGFAFPYLSVRLHSRREVNA
jgi:hypothetical protein